MEKQTFLEKLWALLVEFFASWFKSKEPLPAPQPNPAPAPLPPKKSFKPFWLITKDQLQTSGEWADLWRLKLVLVTPEGVSEPIYGRSGVRGAQFFRLGKDSVAGSMEPLPHGKYKMGQEDWGTDLKATNKKDNYGGDVNGLGPVVWELVPLFWTSRSLIYIHWDSNFETSPGSAGCYVISHLNDVKKFVALRRANASVTDVFVDFELGGLVLPNADEAPVSTPPNEDKPKLNTVWDESPNFNNYREAKVDTMVLHNTDGTLASAVTHFNKPTAQVSAHYIVGRKGEVVKMVQEAHTAWHSGTRATNHRSIGIEIEAYEKAKGMTEIQEKTLVLLMKDILTRHAITRIIPHRKNVATSCPGWIWTTDEAFNAWVKKNIG